MDLQAVAVQQELSPALISNIAEWAQCGLAMTAVRQLVQLELDTPFLTASMKMKVRCSTWSVHNDHALIPCCNMFIATDLKSGAEKFRC